MNKLTNKHRVYDVQTNRDAWDWLGNRGEDAEPKDVKLYRGRFFDFALVRYCDNYEGGWHAEVDCIPIVFSMYAEPYKQIAYADSPFKQKNQARTSQAMTRVEADYQEYIREISNG